LTRLATQGNPHPDLVDFFEHKRPQLIELQRGGSGISWIGDDQGRAEGGEAEILFFDPSGHGDARDAKHACKATQTATFLIGMQDLLAARLRIGMGSRVLAALTFARAAAIKLFAIGSMAIAYQSVALTVRAV